MAYNRPIPEEKQRKGMSGLRGLVQAEKLMQIALMLPSAAFIGWLLGAWLDKRLHQSWITVAGVLLGIVAGMVSAVRMAVEIGSEVQRSDDKSNKDKKEDSGGPK